MTSILKSFYGDNATKENEFGYQYLPKMQTVKTTHILSLFNAMYKEELEGLFLFGYKPCCRRTKLPAKKKKHLANLKWMVAIDLWETETSAFWQKEAGADPASIQTEVFFLPACSSFEKEGSVSNSGRWMQYRWQAIKPKGRIKSRLRNYHMNLHLD